MVVAICHFIAINTHKRFCRRKDAFLDSLINRIVCACCASPFAFAVYTRKAKPSCWLSTNNALVAKITHANHFLPIFFKKIFG
jgi:uncharacterized membrane protein YGL010W